ncbi:capsid cement protein [Roseiconus lacunae]|uniref:capsid cement protein n=1 Tax=Roseiconus lacunae TaxID=2605694 RepID=UPI0011F28D61|nr:capsid cement protein [Roseiconus lacunae]
MIGTFRENDDFEALITPAADIAPGEVIELDDGRAAINNSNNTLVSGKPARVRTQGIVVLPAPSALVLADGAAVHIASDTVAASGGYKVGAARRGGKANGETEVYVALNA